MLDSNSEDIDGMDDDAEEEKAQNPPFTGRWTATSSYDVYMVDTPKEVNGEDKGDPVEDKPHEIQPKRRRQRRRSKSRRGKDNNTDTGENNTPDDAEDNEEPIEATSDLVQQGAKYHHTTPSRILRSKCTASINT